MRYYSISIPHRGQENRALAVIAPKGKIIEDKTGACRIVPGGGHPPGAGPVAASAFLAQVPFPGAVRPFQGMGQPSLRLAFIMAAASVHQSSGIDPSLPAALAFSSPDAAAVLLARAGCTLVHTITRAGSSLVVLLRGVPMLCHLALPQVPVPSLQWERDVIGRLWARAAWPAHPVSPSSLPSSPAGTFVGVSSVAGAFVGGRGFRGAAPRSWWGAVTPSPWPPQPVSTSPPPSVPEKAVKVSWIT